MAELDLKGVCKTYPGGVDAVRDVTLHVNDREFLVLVGPSGCGKSTLLRMIAGLEEITAGEVFIEDRSVNRVAPKDRDIAMVFQNYALYPHMTVYKNMAFGLKLRKYPKAEIDRRVRDAAEILELQELLQRRPKALSGGQRQRVAVGRAIVRNPKVFLFDEPLSNLDAKLRIQMRTELNKLHSRLQATMIYVTHDQVEAMTMGDRIAVMLDGVIQQVAAPMELYHRPANRFVAGFIGSPPMNFLEGRIAARNGGLAFNAKEGSIALPVDAAHELLLGPHRDRNIVLGIRPHHISNADGENANGRAVPVRVEVVEPMGPETHLHLAAGPHALTACVAPDHTPEPGLETFVEFDMARAHYFDAESGEAIAI